MTFDDWWKQVKPAECDEVKEYFQEAWQLAFADGLAGAAPTEKTMNNCKNCQHWQTGETRYNRAIDPEYNPATGDEWASEEEKRQFFPDTVRYCKHPKVVFYQRPESNGVAVFDGSEYMAYLATGQDYGCVNFAPANK